VSELPLLELYQACAGQHVLEDLMVAKTENHKRIIVALDFAREEDALSMIKHLDPDTCRVKIGKELFTRCGPVLVEKIVRAGFDVFLDLKFHDIPHTVARACVAAAELGVWMINVHALGGRAMMQGAREALETVSHRPLLIGVTILTSMDDQDVQEMGLSGKAADNTVRLADLVYRSGLDGVVCSPQEVGVLRRSIGTDFVLVTPGIRPQNSQQDDQKRIMTPAEAIRAGADYLVIGRPITAAADPGDALQALQTEVENAFTA